MGLGAAHTDTGFELCGGRNAVQQGLRKRFLAAPARLMLATVGYIAFICSTAQWAAARVDSGRFCHDGALFVCPALCLQSKSARFFQLRILGKRCRRVRHSVPAGIETIAYSFAYSLPGESIFGLVAGGVSTMALGAIGMMLDGVTSADGVSLISAICLGTRGSS